jgi:hypothetical protein
MTTRLGLLTALLLGTSHLLADQVELQNGDRFAGKVVSMTADTIVPQSDVLGRVSLPRAKVANVHFGSAAGVNAASTQTPGSSPASAENRAASLGSVGALGQMGASSKVVEIIRRQMLSDAGPQANSKYDELAAGVFSGKFDLQKLRKEAITAANQIRELKKGGDVGDSLDDYLAILDNFIRKSGPPAEPVSTATVASVNTNSGGTTFSSSPK